MLQQTGDTIIWSVLPLVVSLVGSIIILSTLLWQYALFLLIFSIVFSIVVYYGSKPMAKLTKKEAKASNKLNGQLADVISNVAPKLRNRNFSQKPSTLGETQAST